MNDKIKVLMVDDEEKFRETTRKILNKRGFNTILAASGEEAIEKIAENPDVVILDIKMPGIDGLEALKEIKKLSPEVPVIMLTGHGAEDSARDALDKGAFDYLTKPCDIDLLASKIVDAHRHGAKLEPAKEKLVKDVMISIEDYTTMDEERTVSEAIEELKNSFLSKVSTSRIMETGHRSIVVFDRKGKMQGILAISDLMRAIMPAYLSAPKPSLADSIQYSVMFWAGMFSLQIKTLGKKKVKEIMSPAPLTIDANANLMEAAYTMVQSQARRLAVMSKGKVAGIIREQDLFFEMEKILQEGKK
jgi:CheY-like chemotaxis protein